MGVTQPGRVVFIAGSSRSGTTMLAHVLARHDAMHAPPELHFFEELWDPGDGDRQLDPTERRRLVSTLLHRARTGYNLPPAPGRCEADVDDLAAAPGSAVDLFARVLHHEAARAGATIPVEQTPRNAFALAAILRRFPDARVVSLVRDPRDVALSQRNWWKRARLGSTNLTWRTTVRRLVDYHPVTISLIWRSTTRAVQSVEDPRHLRVRFEDLVRCPEATVAAICRHVGVAFRPEMLDVAATSSSNRHDAAGRRGLDPGVVGRWSEQLPRAHRWVVERITGPELVDHRYEPAGGGPGPGIVLVAVTFAPKVVLALWMNRHRTRDPVRSVLRRLR